MAQCVPTKKCPLLISYLFLLPRLSDSSDRVRLTLSLLKIRIFTVFTKRNIFFYRSKL